jgi:hypothetical protein
MKMTTTKRVLDLVDPAAAGAFPRAAVEDLRENQEYLLENLVEKSRCPPEEPEMEVHITP